jgi:hemerythrin-like metal-binding protein
MSVLEWRAGLELGLEPMDATHREFVALLNDLDLCPDSELPCRLQQFAAHTVAHFEQENAWMRACGFPPIGCHTGEHERVLSVIFQVLEMVNGGSIEVGRRLIAELPAWFEHHAATMDDALAYYIRISGFDVAASSRPPLQPPTTACA